MLKATKQKPPRLRTKKQLLVLEALEKAARRLGLKVSAGRLRFAGLRLKGGNCLFRGEKWLVFDKTQPFEEVVEIYRQALGPDDLAACGLPEDDRRLLSPYFLPESNEPQAA